MKTSHIIDIARKTIKRAAKKPAYTAPSVLRLDEALLARATSEELGEVSVDTLLLYPRVLQAVKAPGPRDYRDTLVIGVDSSSRQIDIPQESIVVASVSVSSNSTPSLGDWPPLYGRALEGLEEPFIYVLPSSDDVDEPVEDYVTMSNPAGARYDESYSVYQAMDEARVNLENKALKALTGYVEEQARRRDVVVLIDGPLYLVTGALTSPGVRYEYRMAWEALLKERIEAVKRLERAGAMVYGVVKRIDRARLLSMNPAVDGRVRSCIGDSSYSDKLALYRALARPPCTRYTGNGGGYALASSLLAVSYNGLGIGKAVQYTVLPVPRWRPSPHASRYYRVEESLEAWRSRGGRWRGYTSPAYAILLDSLSRGSLAPVTISHSDRRAKEITAYLKAIISFEAARNNIPISYSTEIEVNMLWARIAA